MTHGVSHSYGVACFRKLNSRTQVLMIRRRFSYEYTDFICGKYVLETLPDLVRNMTMDEKLLIASMNFKYIWYSYSLSTKYGRNYNIKKLKFDKVIIKNQERVLDMLRSTTTRSSDSLWELPKGRKRSRRETDIQCAVREFGEETSCKKNKYSIYPDIHHTYTYKDGSTYSNKYYLAITDIYFSSIVLYDNTNQINELKEVRWVDLLDIRTFSRNPDASQSNLSKFLRPMFKIARNIFKGKVYHQISS
jgi:8-oxo-dGTP pyrophosphatase MutT (NUDIX family)